MTCDHAQRRPAVRLLLLVWVLTLPLLGGSLEHVLAGADGERRPSAVIGWRGADWLERDGRDELVDVYHELQQPKAMLAKMREALRPGGKIALVEYRLEGPSALHILEDHRMSPKQVLFEWQPAGYSLVGLHGFLPTQHLFIFEKTPDR